LSTPIASSRRRHRRATIATRWNGYRVPSGSAEGFIQRVRALPMPGRLLSVVAPLLAVLCHLNQQLASSDATIDHLAAQDPRVPRLHSVPGVGPVTAAAFIVASDDAQRFHHAHPLEATQALCPHESPATVVQDTRPPHPACSVFRPPERR
jgi:transposase